MQAERLFKPITLVSSLNTGHYSRSHTASWLDLALVLQKEKLASELYMATWHRPLADYWLAG